MKDLTCRLLERDPLQRLTAMQALAHPWIQADMTLVTTVSNPISPHADRESELKRERLKASVDEGVLESFLHAVLAVWLSPNVCVIKSFKTFLGRVQVDCGRANKV